MQMIFINDCAVDGCYKKNAGNGKQMCQAHQADYEAGKPLKAFYGKTVQKKIVAAKDSGNFSHTPTQ